MLLESEDYKSKIFKDLFIILNKIEDIRIRKAINYFLAESKIRIVKNENCVTTNYYFTNFEGKRLSKDEVKNCLKYW